MISQETIDKIENAADLVEVIGERMSLKRSGVAYIGCCPFHNEKTPSFHVTPSKNIWKCFGCGKGGLGSASFMMEIDHISFPEALSTLAKKYNVTFEEREQTDQEKEAEHEREAIQICLNFAQGSFYDNRYNAVLTSYLSKRGIKRETSEAFDVGYSYAQYNGFTNKALSDGYKLSYLCKSGLSCTKPCSGYGNSSVEYDYFVHRIMFPFYNVRGVLTGFTGRAFDDESKPKYKNSPEMATFHKGKEIFGLYQAKNYALSEDKMYLVEGQFDVMSMYQAGIKNVVAGSGTALTADQARILRKLTNNIVLVYDGDVAGINASLKNIKVLLSEGLYVSSVPLPKGEDPDSFIRKESGIAVQTIKRGELNFMDYIFKQYDPSSMIPIRMICELISFVPDEVEAALYINQLSKLTNLSIHNIADYILKEHGRIIRMNRDHYAYEPTPFEKAVKNMRIKQKKASSLRTPDAYKSARTYEREVDQMIECLKFQEDESSIE